MNIEKSRWYVQDNELSASYLDWVVSLYANYEEAETLYWTLKFFKGSGQEQDSVEIDEVPTLEKAFEIVSKVENINKYEDLILALEKIKVEVA
jgi:hypothetical protein